MTTLEQKVNRTNTDSFIAARPVQLSLIPVVKERTASAGFKFVDQEPRAPQTFRLIEYSRTSAAVTSTIDGKERIVAFELLGSYGATMEINDHWTSDDGRQWYVDDMMRDNDYEVRGLVTEHGE